MTEQKGVMNAMRRSPNTGKARVFLAKIRATEVVVCAPSERKNQERSMRKVCFSSFAWLMSLNTIGLVKD